jgi:hypothetical protein
MMSPPKAARFRETQTSLSGGRATRMTLASKRKFTDWARQWRLLAGGVEHIDCARSKVDFGEKYP